MLPSTAATGADTDLRGVRPAGGCGRVPARPLLDESVGPAPLLVAACRWGSLRRRRLDQSARRAHDQRRGLLGQRDRGGAPGCRRARSAAEHWRSCWRPHWSSRGSASGCLGSTSLHAGGLRTSSPACCSSSGSGWAPAQASVRWRRAGPASTRLRYRCSGARVCGARLARRLDPRGPLVRRGRPWPRRGPHPHRALLAAGLRSAKRSIQEPVGIRYLITPLVWLLGRDPMALRLPAIVFGTLGVVAIYLLARALYGWRVGIVAGALAIGFVWHLNFSRVAFPAIPSLT